MKLRNSILLLLAAAAIAIAAENSKLNQLVYQYPTPDGVKKFWICPPRQNDNPVPPGGTPWEGCKLYDKAADFFRAGDVVQLWVVSYPMLSRFKVEIQNEKVIAPNLAYIRGVSDADPASDAGKAQAQSGKSVKLPTVAKTPDEVKQIEDRLGAIENGNQTALREALDALTRMQIEADKARATMVNDLQPALPMLDLIIGPGQPGYPGPSLQAIKDYAASLANSWEDIKTETCVRESVFQAKAGDTDLLVRGVKDFNTRVGTLPDRDAIAKAGQGLVDLTSVYLPVAAEGRKIMQAALKGFRNIAPQQIQAVTEGTAARPQAGTPSGNPLLDNFDKRFHAGSQAIATLAANDAAAMIRQVAQETADASLWVYRGATWPDAMSLLDMGPGELNERIAEIFAKANQIYRTARSCDDIVIPIKQWTGSAAADLAISEVPGFNAYGLGSTAASNAAIKPKQPGDGQPQDQTPKTKVKIPGGKDDDPPTSWTEQADPADNGAKQDKTAGDQPSGDQSGQPATKPDQPKPVTGLSEVVPVKIHRFARANFISGFASSWLKSREYGIGTVGRTDMNGKPVLDANGGQLSIRSAVETRNQPHQYLYYVGLNFYLQQRDLYPGAKGIKYWLPGLMFAYGVNQEFNFLTGLNWETKWGLNFGGGMHFGQVTGLPNFGGIPGKVPLPDSVTTVTTVQRFGAAPYISIGFDASVFNKVWGAAKGVKGAN